MRLISVNEFINACNRDLNVIELDYFLKHMQDAYSMQHYLNEDNFNLLQKFLDYGRNLENNPNLNSTQKKVLIQYEKILNQKIESFTKQEEQGVTRKYTSNGFINTTLIILATISFGLFIAYLFINRI